LRDQSHSRLILTGLGNVGRSFLGILQSHGMLLRERYGVAFSVVGVADSGGAAVDPAGLDLGALLAAKQSGRSVATLHDVGRAGMSSIDLARSVDAELLLESTPVNLTDGQPGLDTARIALQRGIHVVLANKGPLALAYAELAALSDLSGGQGSGIRGQELVQSPNLPISRSPCLRFSACVGGALPSVNIGRRDLIGCRIERVEAVLNGTTHLILRMMENGAEYAAALVEAQQRGIAETDPTLDVEGWDAANKLVILANAVLNQPTTLADVSVTGITNLTVDELRAAVSRDEKIVLLCLAEQADAATPGAYKLSVRPTALPSDHPLARMSGDEMGIVYYTDIAGCASATTLERGPVPTAAAMLRDALNIVLDVH
jgi:homoserine dehydrogenase